MLTIKCYPKDRRCIEGFTDGAGGKGTLEEAKTKAAGCVDGKELSPDLSKPRKNPTNKISKKQKQKQRTRTTQMAVSTFRKCNHLSANLHPLLKSEKEKNFI